MTQSADRREQSSCKRAEEAIEPAASLAPLPLPAKSGATIAAALAVAALRANKIQATSLGQI